MRWAGHVARVGGKTNVGYICKGLVVDGRILEFGWDGVDWTLGTDRQRNTAMDLLVPWR